VATIWALSFGFEIPKLQEGCGNSICLDEIFPSEVKLTRQANSFDSFGFCTGQNPIEGSFGEYDGGDASELDRGSDTIALEKLPTSVRVKFPAGRFIVGLKIRRKISTIDQQILRFIGYSI